MADDFTARWRKASADLHRAQRSRRTRRTAPAITGIRIPAPEGGHMSEHETEAEVEETEAETAEADEAGDTDGDDENAE